MPSPSAPFILAAYLSFYGAIAHTEKWQFGLDGFNQIQVTAGLELRVRTAEEFLIFAEGEKPAIETLDIHLNGTTLVLDRKSGWNRFLFPWSRNTSNVVITVLMPEIHAVSAQAGATASVSGPLKQNLSVTSQSGASVTLARVDGVPVQVSANAGATLVITGTCTTLSASASGGAALNAGGLICSSVFADVSAGATLSVNGTQTLALSASNGGALQAKGRGKITQQTISSGGSLSVRN